MSDVKTIEVEVLRYRPEKDNEPFFEKHIVPYTEELTVLGALHYIKDEVDGSIAYRWSCRMAVCGSCGIMVNGDPKLGCETLVSEYYPTPLKIEPLENFAIEKDLIVDINPFMDKLKQVKPYIIRKNKAEKLEKSSKQTPAQLAQFKQYTMCINCLLCYAACPQMHLNPEFTGPAALALAHRYNLDTRDEGTKERSVETGIKDGIWGCTFVGHCSEVCPKSVDPAAAIQQQKASGAIDFALGKIIPNKSKAVGESS